MSAEIFEYEVEVKLTDKRTKSSKVCTFMVHAYRVSDVIHQLIYTILRDAEHPDALDMKVFYLGPPRRLTELATQAMQRSIDRMLAEIFGAPTSKARTT